MKIRLFSLLAVCSFLILAGCGSSINVNYDMDKSIDFKAFKTYSLLPWDHSASSTVSLIARNKIRDAIRIEMEKRGYAFVENGGDLSVGSSVVIEERIEYVTDPQVHHHMGMGMGGMGMMGPGMGWGMGGMGMMGPGMGMGMGTTWSSPSRVRAERYNAGKLILDVYNSREKRLIWQAVAADRLNSNSDKERRRIPSYVRLLFKRFPVKAK